MDYFNNVLTTFLGLGTCIALYGESERLSDFINIIFISVPKKSRGLTGLERHEDEKWMTDLSFLGELIL